MNKINLDNFPHLINCYKKLVYSYFCTIWSKLLASWWGISIGRGCIFNGLPTFRRHPRSKIYIGNQCKILSSHTSNLIGVNHPCNFATLSEGALIEIGSNCGFSGNSIGCAGKIFIDDNVRCGANSLITDTDWHTDDPRTTANKPVYIAKGVWLGVNVMVLKGVIIGENTIVAAGSVVTRSLPPNVVAGGIPAKPLRKLPNI